MGGTFFIYKSSDNGYKVTWVLHDGAEAFAKDKAVGRKWNI